MKSSSIYPPPTYEVIYILYGRVQNVVTIGPDLVPIPFQVLHAQILSLYPSRFYMPRSCPYTLPGFTCPDLVPIPFQVLHAQILSLYPSRFYMPRSCPYTLPGFTCPDLVPILFQVLHVQILSLYHSRFYMPRSCPYTLPGFTCPDLVSIPFQVFTCPDHKTHNHQKCQKSTTQSFYICLHDVQSLQMKKKNYSTLYMGQGYGG